MYDYYKEKIKKFPKSMQQRSYKEFVLLLSEEENSSIL